MNSSLPGGVQAILKEKKGDLESAAKILLQEFQKSGGVNEQLATLNDFLEFTNRQSQNLTQGDFLRYLRVEGQKIIQINEMNYFFHYSICLTNFQ